MMSSWGSDGRDLSPRSLYHFLLNADGQQPMSLRDQMLGIFSTASHREDADYSKHITSDAKYAVLMCYRDVVRGSQSRAIGHVVYDPGGEWLGEVVRQLSHAHLDIDRLLASGDLPRHDHPLDTLSKYLLAERTPSSHFLDFLELSLGATVESHIPRDNEFVDGLNLVLEQRASPVPPDTLRLQPRGIRRWHRSCQHICPIFPQAMGTLKSKRAITRFFPKSSLRNRPRSAVAWT